MSCSIGRKAYILHEEGLVLRQDKGTAHPHPPFPAVYSPGISRQICEEKQILYFSTFFITFVYWKNIFDEKALHPVLIYFTLTVTCLTYNHVPSD